MTNMATPEPRTLGGYLVVLRRRLGLVVLSLLVVPGVAAFIESNREPLYEAEARVLLSRQNLAASLTGATDPTLYDAARYVQTQAEVAEAPEVAERTLEAAGVENRSVEELMSAATISVEPNVDLLKFEVQDTDPQVAGALANEYATQFTLYRAELDTLAISRARREVQQSIQALGGRSSEQTPLLQSLLDKEQQLITMETLQTSNTFVVRNAGDAAQVRPKTMLAVVLGVIFGLTLGLMLVAAAEAIDTRVRSPEELTARLGLPLLGRIPTPRRRLRRGDVVAMLTHSSTSEAEAFRILRTNVDFMKIDREVRSIMVTSALEGEGKSTTVANLAAAYARVGRDVTLVDLDLRQPSLARLLRSPERPGITDVVLGYARLEQATVSVPLPEQKSNGGVPSGDPGGALRFIPAGTLPPDAGEFIASDALRIVLETLQESTDLLLIDAPPALPVGDAMALSANTDAMIVVSRLRFLSRSTVAELGRLVGTSPAHKLGLIITGDGSSGAYGYGSYGRADGGKRTRPAPAAGQAVRRAEPQAESARRTQGRR